MKPFLALVLGLLLLQPGAHAATYDDDDDDDAPAVRKPTYAAVPHTPKEKYKARMDTFNAQMEIRRDQCKLSSSMSLDFCTRELEQAELQGRHKIEAQYKEDLAREAGGTAPAQ